MNSNSSFWGHFINTGKNKKQLFLDVRNGRPLFKLINIQGNYHKMQNIYLHGWKILDRAGKSRFVLRFRADRGSEGTLN